MSKRFCTAFAFLAMAVAVSAQTVTVNKGGTGSHATLAAALASFNPDPNPSAANVIQVTDSAVYDEVVSINVPITLEATASEKATIALQGNASGMGGNSGLLVNLPHPEFTTGTVIVRNFNIIPSLSTASSRLTAAVEQINANVYLMLDNVIICPNDGADKPLVTDAVTNRVTEINYANGTNPLYNPSIVSYNDDGIIAGRTGDPILEGDGVELVLRDTVISHFRSDITQVKGPGTPDCVVFGGGTGWPTPSYRKIRVEGTGGYSYGRIGLYMFGDVKIQGDPADRLNIRGHSLAGIYLEFPTQATTSRDIANVIIDGVSQYGIFDNGRGNIRYSLKNSILYYFGRGCVFTKKQTVAVGGDNIFENCTMVDGRKGGYHTFRWEGGNTMNIVMRNCILGGKYDYTTQTATNQGFNTVWFSTSAGATFDLESSAVITTGPFALRPGAPFASIPTSMNSVIFNDARFLSNGSPIIADGVPYYSPSATPGTYDSGEPGFMNVSSPAYAEAGLLEDRMTSTSLGGGAMYVGPPSAVNDWQMYAHGPVDHDAMLRQLVLIHDRKMSQN